MALRRSLAPHQGLPGGEAVRRMTQRAITWIAGGALAGIAC
jgi:hypothetical protein